MYFTSDTHWKHKNIIKYSNRPFSSVEEMDRVMITNWNNVVGTEDEVFHLGDFAFCSDSEFKDIINQLNGRLTIILGNHDAVVNKNRDFLRQKNIKVVDYKEIRNGNEFIVLSHYAKRVWNKSHHGSWHLFGHTHGTLPPLGKSVDVGVDSNWITGKTEYRPFSLQEIRSFMNSQEIHNKVGE